MRNKEQLVLLIQKLKARNNPSSKFFEDLLEELTSNLDSTEAKERLKSCFAITQYSNFTAEEEKLLAEVIDGNLDS